MFLTDYLNVFILTNIWGLKEMLSLHSSTYSMRGSDILSIPKYGFHSFWPNAGMHSPIITYRNAVEFNQFRKLIMPYNYSI